MAYSMMRRTKVTPNGALHGPIERNPQILIVLQQLMKLAIEDPTLFQELVLHFIFTGR